MTSAGIDLPRRRAWLPPGAALLAILTMAGLVSGCGGKRPPASEEEAYVAAAFAVVMKYCQPPGRQQSNARLATGVVDRIRRLNQARDVDAPFTLFPGQQSSLRKATKRLAEMLDDNRCDPALARRLRRSLDRGSNR